MAIQETNWHPWFKAAMSFGRQNKSWFAVQVGSQQDKDWKAYFQNLGWTPTTVFNAHQSYTMPIELPSWLPHDFEPMKDVDRQLPTTRTSEQIEDRSWRPTLDELLAKYGPNWGLGSAGRLKSEAQRRAQQRAEAEEVLARSLLEENLPSNLSVSDELRKILVQR